MQPKHTDFNRLTPDEGDFGKGCLFGVTVSMILWGIIYGVMV
jgi:hypothetical protein